MQLRVFREQRKLSQARLAELTGIPQHILSSFELEKSELLYDQERRITDLLSNIERYNSTINRRKRYRHHTYENTGSHETRAAIAEGSERNPEYLNVLRSLIACSDESFSAISLFSGCGGFSLGFASAGCKIKGFVEVDEGLSTIYSKNFPNTKKIGSDITTIKSRDIASFRINVGDIDVVIGGPPCQGFSLSGKRDIEDYRNYLFREYMRFLHILNPKFAILENVRLLTSMKSKHGGLVKDEIIDLFCSHGYIARYFNVNACHYGVPQHRERVFFVAVRSDMGRQPTFPEPEYGRPTSLFDVQKPVRTFADACSDLEYIESGQKTADPLHAAVKHPDHVVKWLWHVPPGASAHDNDDPNLRPPSGYNTTYKRQIWDKPASTVQTTFGMISGCRNVHPIATRSLTIREATRLQSFSAPESETPFRHYSPALLQSTLDRLFSIL